MEYRISKVGDNWDFLPQKEKDKKKAYEKVVRNIERKESKIERALTQIDKDKKDLRELKKLRRLKVA